MIPNYAYFDLSRRARRMPRMPSGARNGQPIRRRAATPALAAEPVDVASFMASHFTLLDRHAGYLPAAPLARL